MKLRDERRKLRENEGIRLSHRWFVVVRSDAGNICFVEENQSWGCGYKDLVVSLS